MNRFAPDRLQRRSYPCWVTVSPITFGDGSAAHQVARYFEEARVLMMRRVLGTDCWTSDAGRLTLAFHATDFCEEIPTPAVLEAGGGVLRVGGSSVTVAMALFSSDRCVAVCDGVLTHVGPDGMSPWSVEQRSILSGLEWRYFDSDC